MGWDLMGCALAQFRGWRIRPRRRTIIMDHVVSGCPGWVPGNNIAIIQGSIKCCDIVSGAEKIWGRDK